MSHVVPSVMRTGSWFGSWQVSSCGRVRNTFGVISRGSIQGCGYRRVLLTTLFGQKSFLVHRLVAYAFHGLPPTPQHVVNHKDFDRANNCIENLEYVTHTENVQHAVSAGKLRGRTLCKAVRARLAGDPSGMWHYFSSSQDAALAAGVCATSVSKCCHGKIASCKGSEFQFVVPPDLPGERWVEAVCSHTGAIISDCKVSSLGRIHGPAGSKTYGWSQAAGYRSFRLNGKTQFIHRVVICSFLGRASLVNKHCLVEVHHEDGNKANNRIENLRVVTRSENVRHAWRMRSSNAVEAKRRPVEGRQQGTNSWHKFNSVTEAADHVGTNVGCVSQCCSGSSTICRWVGVEIQSTG